MTSPVSTPNGGPALIRLLILGAGGQVGRSLTELSAPGIRIIGAGRTDADLTRPETLDRIIGAEPWTAVVNAAAYTAVDRAEQEPDLAFAINRDGAAAAARACAAAGTPLIHLSTDYVFDGSGRTPYGEDATPRPLNTYGESKLAGERAVADILSQHIILRTSWVFAPFGQNFVRTILRLAGERRRLDVVDDQTGCPTAAADLAAAILTIARHLTASAEEKTWGTFHLCSAEPVTWHGFARAILDGHSRLTGAPAPALHPVPTTGFPTPARRPAWSVLSCGRLENRFGIPQPDWRTALDRTLAGLLAPPPSPPLENHP